MSDWRYTRTGFWCLTNTGDQVQFWLCRDCGAFVHDKPQHDAWHESTPA